MTQAKFKRFNFSLTNDISDHINEISYIPKDFNATRSDVVKASILYFKNLSEEEKVNALRKVCENKTI